MHNWCDRWSGDQQIFDVAGKTINKTAELQVSFFNGLGYETWENVPCATVSPAPLPQTKS